MSILKEMNRCHASGLLTGKRVFLNAENNPLFCVPLSFP